MHFTKSQARTLSAEFPIGDPFGGPAYGEYRDIGSVVGGGLSLVGGLLGGSEQANATESAANTSAGATRDAIAAQRAMYDQTRADQTPWREAGVNALNYLTKEARPGGGLLRDFNMQEYQQDPGYQFRLSEGLKALERSAAARGGLLSGAALKGITRYGQDYASNEYQNAFNRYQTNQGNQFNRLAAMAGLGQTANGALQTAGTNYGNQVAGLGVTNAANIGNAQLAAGNARASSYQGIGNALGRMNFGNMLGGSVVTSNYSDPNSYYYGGGEA